LSHVNNLDYNSAFVAELRGGQQVRGWNDDRYISAALVNSVRAQNYMFLLANSDPKKNKPEAPKPWPLPDDLAKEKRQDKPGSFAFIAKALAAKARKRKVQQ
jgi:hypothetical protein